MEQLVPFMETGPNDPGASALAHNAYKRKAAAAGRPRRKGTWVCALGAITLTGVECTWQQDMGQLSQSCHVGLAAKLSRCCCLRILPL